MAGRPPLPVGTFGKVTFVAQASGAVQARVRFRDYDGRARLASKTARTKAAAERALRDAVRERQAPGAGGGVTADTRVRELAEVWLGAAEGWSTGTARTYKSMVKTRSGRPWATCGCGR